MRTKMVIIQVIRVLLFFKRSIVFCVWVGSVVLSFCDLTVFVFFLQEYKYGENENRWLRLVCVGILGVERKKIKTV